MNTKVFLYQIIDIIFPITQTVPPAAHPPARFSLLLCIWTSHLLC